MEDKTFELLTKMYADIMERFDGVNKKLDGVDKRLDDVEQENKGLRNDVLRLENKLDNNSKALLDGYHQTYEKLTAVETKVDELSTKLDKQDVEIRVIKGGK